MWFARAGTFWGRLGKAARAYSDGLRQAGYPDTYAGAAIEPEKLVVVEPADQMGQDRDPAPKIGTTMTTLHDFTVKTRSGADQSLAEYAGHPVVVVNTASKCGLTPQLQGLQELYTEFHDQGLEILGFPCDQFAHQAPGTADEQADFCQLNYGVTFPMFAKIDVNGDDADPLYTWLRGQKGGMLGDAIKWNFTKFLIDADGNVVKRYAPHTSPEKLREDIEALLKK